MTMTVFIPSEVVYMKGFTPPRIELCLTQYHHHISSSSSQQKSKLLSTSVISHQLKTDSTNNILILNQHA